ncbi:MAG: DUF4340 domain-containing protein [Chloroflexi bacterium]|nr:DUF4340 domain-containing protein [Chloroflexota bacterium]
MVRRQTWILLILLAALVGFAYYLNQNKKEEIETATPATGSSPLFDEIEGQVSRIEIRSDTGDQVVIARQGESWMIEEPVTAVADPGKAEAAASQITALRKLNEYEGNLDIFGLDQPSYTIKVTFSEGAESSLEIGDITPTSNGYYVRKDMGNILVVSLNGIEPLTDLLASPPYLNTPTPTTSPATATPELQATVTPTP